MDLRHQVGLSFVFLMMTTACFGNSVKTESHQPLPVPLSVRVQSSGPRVQLWNSLSEKNKNLAYHLIRASQAGRAILFHQNHRHGLAIRQMMTEALKSQNTGLTRKVLKDGFDEFLRYAAMFEKMSGPYSNSNRKYVLNQVTGEQVYKLFQIYSPALAYEIQRESVKLMTDPQYEVIQYPESTEGTDLEKTGTNLYQKGITGAEVAEAVKASLKSDLNCRIIRGEDRKPKCDLQALSNPKLDPIVKAALTQAVTELQQAKKYSSTEHQTQQIQHLIQFFQKGEIEDFRKFNIEWVKDRSQSVVDFMMGYVEVYNDYLNKIGSWESYVQIVDPNTTELSLKLAKHAQYFEDSMPYGAYKKKFPENYSPPALMVYYFQEIAAMASGGYNLPNFDDLRRDVGAKNIIRLDLPGEENDPDTQKIYDEMFKEFLPAKKVAEVAPLRTKYWRVLVLLHEIIGHGSGVYDVTRYGEKEDPISALGPLGSALEEQRADLAGLVFAGDPKLVEVGIYTNQEEAEKHKRALYDGYLADFLRRFSKARSFTEPHMRGHWLFVSHALETGAVRFASKDGSEHWTPENFVLEVVDYQKYYETARNLLAELQRIKAVRDETKLRDLFEEYAPLSANQTGWAKEAIKRGFKLKINQGSIEQPWMITHNKEFKLLGSTQLEDVAQVWHKQSFSLDYP